MSFEHDCDHVVSGSEVRAAVFVPGQTLLCPWEVALLVVGLRATASLEVPAPMCVQKQQKL